MRRLYVLRPEPGSSATVDRARSLGLDARALPLFETRALAWQAPDPARFDALLLTSANAVGFGGNQLERLKPLPAYAIGEATADAARGTGFRVDAVGQGDIDDLLRLVPRDLRLLHLCGDHRRLTNDSGHSIAPLPVYRAEPLPIGGIGSELKGHVAAIHSPRAGARLAELVRPPDRHAIRIASISETAAEAVGTGWSRVESAAEPNDAALLALAARLCKETDRT